MLHMQNIDERNSPFTIILSEFQMAKKVET